MHSCSGDQKIFLNPIPLLDIEVVRALGIGEGFAFMIFCVKILHVFFFFHMREKNGLSFFFLNDFLKSLLVYSAPAYALGTHFGILFCSQLCFMWSYSQNRCFQPHQKQHMWCEHGKAVSAGGPWHQSTLQQSFPEFIRPGHPSALA